MLFINRQARRFSIAALILGLAFFSASLTPSLLPRTPLMQGLLGGLALAAGYGVMQVLLALWRFMQLRELSGRVATRAGLASVVVMFIVTLLTLTRVVTWQNSIRERMAMPFVDSAYPLTVLAVAIIVSLLLILVARFIVFLVRRLARWLRRVMPPRVALVTATVVLGVLLINLFNGLILSTALEGLDDTFAAVDRSLDEKLAPPTDPRASGAPGSLIAWNDLGQYGKEFVRQGPTREAITTLTGRPARRPIRVYAGYNSGATLEERAALALAELIRVGGFQREVLVVATPTGTGWLDPAATDPLEYLHGGDIATVSMQYSYLPSWLTLFIDPDRSRRSAAALFDAVYAKWTALPEDQRPRLYLFGVSLGALGAEAALDFLDLLGDPIDGAVLAGAPFPSTIWPTLVRDRVAHTPAWRPVFRDASLVRFQTRAGIVAPPGAEWGVMRIIYIQHASDPNSWFSPSLAWREPDWLQEPRGPDVSPYVDWFPVVTFLQVGFDLLMANQAPPGYAHQFAPGEYIDAWIEVSQPDPWRRADTAALKAAFAGD